MFHPGFGQLLNLLDLIMGEDFQVANDVRAVPLVLFHHGLQQETRVPFAILVAAEQTATPRLILVNRKG